MKKGILSLTLIVLCFIFVLSAIANDITGWGKFDFGMSYEQVSNLIQTTELRKEGLKIWCSTKETENIKGLDYKQAFIFKNNKLVEIQLVSGGQLSSPSDLAQKVSSMKEVLEGLTGKYGPESRTWKDVSGTEISKQWSAKSGTIIYSRTLVGGLYVSLLKYKVIDNDL